MLLCPVTDMISDDEKFILVRTDGSSYSYRVVSV